MSETLETVRIVDAPRAEAPRGADVSRDFEAQLGDIQNIINEIARNSTAQASDIATDLGRELAHLRRAVEAGTMSPMTLAAMINSFKQQVEIVRAVANNEQAGNLSQVAESARLAMEYERQVAAEIEGFKRWDPDFNEPLYREARTYVDVFGPELGISPQMAPVVARDLQVISRSDPKMAAALRIAMSSPEAIRMYEERVETFDRTRDTFLEVVDRDQLSPEVRRYLRSESGYRPVEMMEVTNLMQEYINNPTPENLRILNERLEARATAVNETSNRIFAQVIATNLSSEDRAHANRDIAENARLVIPTIGVIQIDLTDGVSDLERRLLFRRGENGMSYVETRGSAALQSVLARTQLTPEELFDPRKFFDDSLVTPEERAWITLMRDVSTTRAVSGVEHFIAHAKSREGREIFDALARAVEDAATPEQALAAFRDLQAAGFLPAGGEDGVSMGIIRERFMHASQEERRAFMTAIRTARDSDDPEVINAQMARATGILAGDNTQTAQSFVRWAETQSGDLQSGIANSLANLSNGPRNGHSNDTDGRNDAIPPVQDAPINVAPPVEVLTPITPIVIEDLTTRIPTLTTAPQRDDTRVGGVMDAVTESPLEKALRDGGFSRFGAGMDTIQNAELRAILIEYDASVGNRNGRYSIEEVKEALRYAGVTDITVINANGDNVVDQAELLEALRNVPQRIRDGNGLAVA